MTICVHASTVHCATYALHGCTQWVVIVEGGGGCVCYVLCVGLHSVQCVCGVWCVFVLLFALVGELFKETEDK